MKEEEEHGLRWLNMPPKERVSFIDGCRVMFLFMSYKVVELVRKNPNLSPVLEELKTYLHSDILGTDPAYGALIDWITAWYDAHPDERGVSVPEVILHRIKWGPVHGIRMNIREKKSENG